MEYLVVFVLIASATAFTFPGEDENVKSIVHLSNVLAVDIHKNLSAEGGNVFFSPVTIFTVLAMLFYGARDQTSAEMRLALGYQDERLTNDEVHAAFKDILGKLNGNPGKDYSLHVANALLTQKGFPILPEYQSAMQSIYKATAREVDFQNDANMALQTINDWVKLKTNGQMTDFLRDVDPSTIMILLSAVYFKGTWKTQFEPEDTINGIFYNKGLESQKARVPMMMLVEELPYVRLGGLRALELPYKGNDISMVILLPDARDGLARLEKELTPNMWRDLIRNTRITETTVTFPKFKIEYEKTLNGVLQSLGVRSIFNSPNLSGISTAGGLKVSKLVHKAVIEVNEQGSEASAISGGLIDFKMGGENNYFTVDHPFVYAIFDKRNDLVLFQGRVCELQEV